MRDCPRSAALDLAFLNNRSGISIVVFTRPYYHIYGHATGPVPTGTMACGFSTALHVNDAERGQDHASAPVPWSAA
ncbi:MAG: hypothetical protein EHM56_00905 [Chloroflexi bacterium]|nr:MAG: hypothetical protein EHM56_00905 [Chloroflexota bacterium]